MRNFYQFKALCAFLTLFLSFSICAVEEDSHTKQGQPTASIGGVQAVDGSAHIFSDLKTVMESSLCDLESQKLTEAITRFGTQLNGLPGMAAKEQYAQSVYEISNSFLKYWCHASFPDDGKKFESCVKQLQDIWRVADRENGKLLMKGPVVLEKDFPNEEFLSHLKKVKGDLIAGGAPMTCNVDYLVGPANPEDKAQREVEHERITSAYVDAMVDSISMSEDMRSELIWVHGARVSRLLRQNNISLDGVNRRTKEVLTEKCQSDKACIDRFLPKLTAINEYFWQGALAEEKEIKESPFYEKKIYALSTEEAADIAVAMDHAMSKQKARVNSKPNRLIADLSKAVGQEQAFTVKPELNGKKAQDQKDADYDPESEDEAHGSEDLLAKHWPSYEKPKQIPSKPLGIFEEKTSIDSPTLSEDEKKLVEEFSKKSGLGVKAITKAFEARKKHKGRIRNSDQLVVVDFTMTNSQKRICVLNTKTKAVRCDHVAHGQGIKSFVNSAGSGTKPKYFGNEKEYKLGTFGAHVTVGEKYWSKGKGRYQRTMAGLEPKVNDNAQRDGKVFHKCGYATYGRSHGCISTDSDMDAVLRVLPEGTFVYIYPGTVQRVTTKIKVPYASGDPDSGKYRQAEIWKVVGP